jgi:penicillin-binding protein 1A
MRKLPLGINFQKAAQDMKAWLSAQWLRLRKRTEGMSRLGLAWRIAAVLGGIGMLFLFFLSVLIYKGVLGPLPTYAELMAIQTRTASEVFSEDGVLLGKYYVENRVNADFEEISPNIINALVATEDARFFEHSGIDMRAWARVIIKSLLLFDESSGGGSTLSQQLAKNLYTRRDYWMMSLLVNKIREMFVARRLERIYTKEELLRLYLNTVPFSENVYGVKVASQRFFNKSPEDLAVEEAAVLVGMLKATTIYNPVRNPERALARRNTVLNQMEKYEYISEAECDSLKGLPIALKYHKEGHHSGLATYFREHLRLELDEVLKNYKKPDGSSYNLYTDGLKIYTTINARMQQYAEEAVSEYMPKLQQQFNKGWKKGVPWGGPRTLRKAMEGSKRYQNLKAKGLSEKAIEDIFNHPVRMTIFSWEEGEVEQEMSPLDSIKYYLTIINTGLLAIDPETGLIRAWVGGIDHKYFQYDHVKSRRPVGSIFKPVVYAQALLEGMLPCEYTENKLTALSRIRKLAAPKLRRPIRRRLLDGRSAQPIRQYGHRGDHDAGRNRTGAEIGQKYGHFGKCALRPGHCAGRRGCLPARHGPGLRHICQPGPPPGAPLPRPH